MNTKLWFLLKRTEYFVRRKKMNNIEILYQECKVCGKTFKLPTRKELEKSILFKAAEALGIDMGNGHTGGNSLLAMLNC
jgi:hypothetical protein